MELPIIDHDRLQISLLQSYGIGRILLRTSGLNSEVTGENRRGEGNRSNNHSGIRVSLRPELVNVLCSNRVD